MRMVMATVTYPDGRVEAEPLVFSQIAGIVSIVKDDGELWEVREDEVNGALFAVAHEEAA